MKLRHRICGALAALAASIFVGTTTLAQSSRKLSESSPHGQIVWDTYGVPHIFAKNTAGLFYGFGYAQAKGHGSLLLHLYGESRGRAAEYWGPEYAATDRYYAANNVAERGAEWFGQQSAEMKLYLDAFAKGINDFAAQHPDELSSEAKRVLPVTGIDVMTHWERVMEFNYIMPEQRALPANTPTNEAELHMPNVLESPRDEDGSNGWAIAPVKSANGHPMLLMNPHLGWAPSYQTYFEAQLSAPGIDMYGATQVGFPVLRFCFTDDHGITNTVNTISAGTIYKLTLSGNGYVFDGSTHPFEIKSRSIKIRQPDGSLKEENFEVRTSVHGPVFTRKDGSTVAIRVAGLDRPFGIEEYWNIDRAEGFTAVEAQLKRLQVPTFNILYAGKDGHILYQFNGVSPVRTHGDFAYWSGLVPGDTSENLWTKVHPYEDLPRVLDPPAGWIQNTNNPPWLNTALPLLDPSKYPPYMSPISLSLRSEQSALLLESKGKLTFEDFVSLKLSTRSLMADRLLPDLLRAAASNTDPLVKQAASVLAAWNHSDDNDARGALLFEIWAAKFAGAQFSSNKNYLHPWTMSDPLGTPNGIKDPQQAVSMLADAARETIAKYGAIDRPFGDVSRFHLGNVNLPGNGGFGNTGIFRVITWSALSHGERTPIHGETFIALVEFGNKAKAVGITAYGESSQPGSPHQGDQLQFLSEKKFRPFWRTLAEVKTHKESSWSF
ncbi:penicillin acylase family protein [Terriglobus tenax]|uniref:penicillin acylase family protein n=1 Tax=Terriglobus tenax TaxID=1111115 RepID=UPI0021E0F459|nr:penicillin acylase family protein [Terriglobus tenax]